MLGVNDKVTLCAVDFIDKEGEIVHFSLDFPIKENFSLQGDIIGLSIYEMHQGKHTYGNVVFHIYVGDVVPFKKIAEGMSNKRNRVNINCHIDSLDDNVCYFEDDGKTVIFAKVNDNDIVVNNLSELENVLMQISNNFENIENSIDNIKNINKALSLKLSK